VQTVVNRPAHTNGGERGAGGKPARRGPGHALRLFAVDAALVVAFVAIMSVPLTGVPVHEWLGIALAVGLTTHLVQHTTWIVTTTRRLRTASFRNRLNYLMLLALFVGFVSIIASGLLISEAALPFLGIQPPEKGFWLWLHLVSVGWVLWLTALHIALNWKWLVTTGDRFIRRPLATILGGPRSSRRP